MTFPSLLLPYSSDSSVGVAIGCRTGNLGFCSLPMAGASERRPLAVGLPLISLLSLSVIVTKIVLHCLSLAAIVRVCVTLTMITTLSFVV
jgi:hypothetical protein